MKESDDLKIYTDNGQMRVWASSAYSTVVDSYDLIGEKITYNVHDCHLDRINKINIGDLVSTKDRKTGLVLNWVSIDSQGFDMYKIMIEGTEFVYSTLELQVIGE